MKSQPTFQEPGCLCIAHGMDDLPPGAGAWRVVFWSAGVAYRLRSPLVTRDGQPPALGEVGQLFLNNFNLFQPVLSHV